MSAKLGTGQGGRGGADQSAARGAGELAEDQVAVLQGKDAKEAVFSLDGDFATDNPFLVDETTFPGPIAEAMYWSDAKIMGIQGPVGSGKTTTLLKSRRRRAIEMPRSVKKETRHGITGHWRLYKLLVVRETYRQLWSTTIPSYLEVFPRELGEWSGGRGDPVTHVIVFEDELGPIEFRVEFMAFGDNIIASMRGVQATDIWLNEMDTMPDDVLMVGVGRINRWPGRDHFEGYEARIASFGQICGDFNAPDQDNFTYRVFHNAEAQKEVADALNKALRSAAEENGVDPDTMPKVEIKFFNQPGYGEPGAENQHNLAADYYATQIALMKLAGRGDMVKRLVYNKITYLKVGDPVFEEEFNRTIHVSTTRLELVPGIPLRIGLDQGLKAAAVVTQFVPPFHWRVYAELHFPKRNMMAAEFGRRLRDLLDERFPGIPIEGGWGDMAGEAGSSLATEEIHTWNMLCARAADIDVRPQKIGANRIQPRLEAIRAPLEYIHQGKPGLLIDEQGCPLLIAGFEARYVYTEEVDKRGDKRKVPNKQYTEANVMDALQYVALSEHRFDGTSPISFPNSGPAQRGRPGRPPRPGQAPLGLTNGHDVLNPYGDL